jgi:metaxin
MSKRSVVPPEWKFDSKDPWDPDTFMIVPIEKSQTLMPEAASILGIQTFLKLAHLPCRIEEKFNASAISPNGKLPVVKCGNYVVSELDGVIHLTQSKGVSMSEHLSGTEKADLRTYLSLVHNVFGNAMLYFCWLDDEVYSKYTYPRVGSPYNFPLRSVLPWVFRRKVRSQLTALKWGKRQPADVYGEVERGLYALSERLGEEEYFFGSSPTELDAIVFGYLFTMLTIKLPLPSELQLVDLVKQHRNLLALVQRMGSEL